jgi:hypothetical protein
MSAKRSRIHLYSADKLDEEALTITSVDSKLSFASPNDFELSGPKFSLTGQTTAAHDISDLGLYLKTLSDTQQTDSTTQAAAIASLTTNLATLDAREQANHSAQATLLGTETARASAAEAVLQSNVDAEATTRAAADTTLQSNVDAEATTRAAADTTLQSNIDTEKSRIDSILAGSSVDLDSFLEVVNAYQNADTSILATIGAIQTQLSALQSQVDTLTA